MAYENLTTFTEVSDILGQWSQTTTRNTGVGVSSNQGSYLYKDYGASNFGDFTHDIDIYVDNIDGGGFIGVWAICDILGHALSMGDYIRIIADQSFPGFQLVLESSATGNPSDNSSTLSFDTNYYLNIERSGTSVICKIYPSSSDRANDTNITDTITITAQSDSLQYLEIGYAYYNGSFTTTDDIYIENVDLAPTPSLEVEDTITLSDDILLSLSKEDIELSDTVTLSDDIVLNLSQESIEIEETITLSDAIIAGERQFINETLGLSDAIQFNLTRETIEINETLNLEDSIEDWRDIVNDFRIVAGVLEDIPSDFRSRKESTSTMENMFNIAFAGEELNIVSDFRSLLEPTSDIVNDFRMLKSYQVPGSAGFQSLGKSNIRVYINGSEETKADMDSININKGLNSAHIASFKIGRPYDTASKPALESEVEIRYYQANLVDYWLIYKGYITGITPTDSPDSIRIDCKDKYWKNNKNKKYFFVGHKPEGNQELYYETISGALSSEFGWNPSLGNFTPQIINVYGTRESDTISQILSQAGNYGWYYNVKGNKKLWTAGQGSIVNLERQELGKNIGLYQVIRHSITEFIDNIKNRFRVKMGDKVIRIFNDTGASKEYAGYQYVQFVGHPTPVWDGEHEKLKKDSSIENDEGESQGVLNHDADFNDDYKHVFVKYRIPGADVFLEKFTDRFKPRVIINLPFPYTGWKASFPLQQGLLPNSPVSVNTADGFSIDFDEQTLTFNQRMYVYKEEVTGTKTNEDGSTEDITEMTGIRKPLITVRLWKKKYYSETDSDLDDPLDSGDITSPLIFLTDKCGDYVDTVWENLDLTGMGIQVGGWYQDGNEDWKYIPSWDDTSFAQDFANWQITKNCDKKVKGTVEITLDAFLHYGLDLTKRIMIDGVLENPLNIVGISFNMSSFTVTLTVENARFYKRSKSIQPRGV